MIVHIRVTMATVLIFKISVMKLNSRKLMSYDKLLYCLLNFDQLNKVFNFFNLYT